MDRNPLLTCIVIAIAFYGCSLGNFGTHKPSREIASSTARWGHPVLPGVVQLTGFDPGMPEIADPYLTQLGDSFLISGTAKFSLEFKSLQDIANGGPYTIAWNKFYYADGIEMEGGQTGAPNWDMKPTLWSSGESEDPLLIWYGGHMRPDPTNQISIWPQDNFSRDVFAFVERSPGSWYSEPDSVFASHSNWPRPPGNYLGHRYGHQIVMTSHRGSPPLARRPDVFYEEVTQVRADGSPQVTSIFVDEMISPFATRNSPTLLISPVNAATGKYFPSTVREDGAALVEGPLYFRFRFQGEWWEAIGFSAGSYFGKYPSCFASRRVSDGREGKPYLLDLTDDGSDLHDAGAELGQRLKMTGGPGRPAVIVDAQGNAIPSSDGELQLLVHGYRHETGSPNYRVVLYAPLSVTMGPRGALRFNIPVQRLLERERVERLDPTIRSLEARKLSHSHPDSTF